MIVGCVRTISVILCARHMLVYILIFVVAVYLLAQSRHVREEPYAGLELALAGSYDPNWPHNPGTFGILTDGSRGRTLVIRQHKYMPVT